MSRILFILIAFIAVVIAVLVVAPGIVPVSAYKPRIEAAASAALGRNVSISEDFSLRIIPRTAFRVKDLTIANADGFDGEYLVRVEEADIGVKLFQLITGGAVAVDRFVLTSPDINLVRKADGAVNWNLAANAPETEASTQSTPNRDINLGDIRIVDGKARFVDNAAGKTYVGENINLTVVLNSLAEPLEVEGALAFQGAPATVDLVVTSLQDFLANEPANLKMDVRIGDATAGADLTITAADTLSYAGPMQLNAPDLPAFAALLGTALEDAPGFDQLSVSGTVDGGDNGLQLSDATISFDEIEAHGALNLDWAGAKPKASGILSTEVLDLRPYLPPPVESANGFPAWSEAKLDFASLRNIDADFDISTDAILLSNLTIGESRLKLKIVDGRMSADIPELAMYGGQGSGSLVVNARGATPSIAGAIDMDAVSAQPLSRDLLKHDNLLGLGSLKFDFIASGSSQADIMRSIDGSGGFDLANGALKGVNIAKIARVATDLREGINAATLQNAVTTALGPDQETDFSQFLSEFSITNGLVKAPTISLTGQYLTMTGTGTINLPNQSIDLRLAPRASTSADAQGGRAAVIPVRVGGTFAKPTIGVDAESIIRGEAVGLLRGLLDDGSSDQNGGGADQQGGDGQSDPAATLLRGLFDEPDKQNGDGSSGDQQSSLEEALANTAINALFGPKEDPSDPEKKDQN